MMTDLEYQMNAIVHGRAYSMWPNERRREAYRVWNVSMKKRGGIRFVRVGRLSFSFCLSRRNGYV